MQQLSIGYYFSTSGHASLKVTGQLSVVSWSCPDVTAGETRVIEEHSSGEEIITIGYTGIRARRLIACEREKTIL